MHSTHIRVLCDRILDELLQFVVCGVDVDAGRLDPVASFGKLVEALLAASCNDHGGLGVEVMESKSKGATDAGGSPDDKDAFRVFDASSGKASHANVMTCCEISQKSRIML